MQGGCLCGAIRYEVERPFSSVSICHCRTCRLASGSPTASWFVVPKKQFLWRQGEPKHFESSPLVQRGFCSQCGTQLTYEHADALSDIELTTGSLDMPSDVLPTKEIWLSERVTWVKVDAELEHYSQGSMGQQAVAVPE